MQADNIKYGLLITAATLFGGSSLNLYAQDENGKTTENAASYKKQFRQSIAPINETVTVEFMVDSVKTKVLNGDLVPDLNVIEMLAYLDPDSDEYQSYMAAKHIVAHELWHRICLMNEVLEQPLSASQYRNGRDNFEITASIVQLLTFREDYIKADEKERAVLRELNDPKIKMYLMAVEQKIINPFSQNKKDFDFEMAFIAKSVSGFWNNNMAAKYADVHNAMTKKAKRKEFSSPQYDKNFARDIKKMNTIGGIDFSKLYNVGDVHLNGVFEKGEREDTAVHKQPLYAPDYETWIDKRSRLKRFSKQKISVPNFTGDRLVREREKRPLEGAVPRYQLQEFAVGVRTYPALKMIVYAGAVLKDKGAAIRIYPDGVMEKISPKDEKTGLAAFVSLNYDGSYEKGQLRGNRKEGTFIYYNSSGKERGRCNFVNGRAKDGTVFLSFNNISICYQYVDGKITKMSSVDKDEKPISLCLLKDGRPHTGTVPKMEFYADAAFLVLKNGETLAKVIPGKNGRLAERQQKDGNMIKIERFYADGGKKYEAIGKLAFSKEKTLKRTDNKFAGGEHTIIRDLGNKPDVLIKSVTDKTAATTGQLLSKKRVILAQSETLYAPNGKEAVRVLHQEVKKQILFKKQAFLDVLKTLRVPVKTAAVFFRKFTWLTAKGAAVKPQNAVLRSKGREV